LSVPRFLFAIPLLVAGAVLPTVTKAPAPAPTGTIGMGHEAFDVSASGEIVDAAGTGDGGEYAAVRIAKGSTLTFVNDSRWLHVIGPGEHGRITSEPGSPSLGPRGAFLSQRGGTYITATWNTPGTYHVTCSLHPEMTVTVTVADG
jgi:plastocyanin